jgi:hypothetical protein
VLFSCKEKKQAAAPPQEQVVADVGTTQTDKTADAPAGEVDPDITYREVGLERFASDEYLSSLVKTRNSEHWYGLYLGGRKAGFAKIVMRPTTPKEPGDYTMAFHLAMRADGDEMRMRMQNFYEGKAPHPMVAVESEESSSAGTHLQRFIRDGENTRVESLVDGKAEETREAPPMCSTLRGDVAAIAPDLQLLSVGDSSTYCEFDTELMENQQQEIRVESLTSKSLNGIPVKVGKLSTKEVNDSTRSHVSVSDKSVPLTISLGGIEMKLEDKSTAQSEIQGIDMASTAVKVKVALGDPQKRKELSMIASVPDGFRLPEGPNQEVKARPDGRYDVKIRSVVGTPVKEEERKDALKTTTTITSTHPKIVATAKKVTKGITERKAQVEALVHWVYANMEGSLSTNLTTATQVLEHLSGDCTEYTMLFVALARALGIPAREVSGVTYGGDDLGFAWHAWAEVELDGKWVQVDPSWDETIANATHLKLGSGKDDEAAAALGALKLEVAD